MILSPPTLCAQSTSEEGCRDRDFRKAWPQLIAPQLPAMTNHLSNREVSRMNDASTSPTDDIKERQRMAAKAAETAANSLNRPATSTSLQYKPSDAVPGKKLLLIDMPSEIRFLVYKHFFQSAYVEIKAIEKLCTPHILKPYAKAILASEHVKECFNFILATTGSKQFRDEVKEAFLSQASFQLPGHDESHSRYHSGFLQPGIRRIVVVGDTYRINTAVPFLSKDNKIHSLASTLSFTGLKNGMWISYSAHVLIV